MYELAIAGASGAAALTRPAQLESGGAPVGWLVAAVVVAILLTMWVTFTLTRLDRLHARVDAARAALDAQLVRRAAALLHVAEPPDRGCRDAERAPVRGDRAGRARTRPTPARRETAENAVGTGGAAT